MHPHELMRALRSITIAAERFEPAEWSLWDAERLESAARVIREGIAERAANQDQPGRAKRARRYHEQAMSWCERADSKRRAGNAEQAKPIFLKALDLERRAAELVEPGTPFEPTRSVLYRSAASLAVTCGEWQEAQRLAKAGLAGQPPHEIAEDLQEVLARAIEMEQGMRLGAPTRQPGD